MPEDTIYVGRGSKFGNPLKLVGENEIYINASHRREILSPWVWHDFGDIFDVLILYKDFLNGCQFFNKDLQYWSDYFSKIDLTELKGKNLACWCPIDKPCHADILLDYVNSLK